MRPHEAISVLMRAQPSIHIIEKLLAVKVLVEGCIAQGASRYATSRSLVVGYGSVSGVCACVSHAVQASEPSEEHTSRNAVKPHVRPSG